MAEPAIRRHRHRAVPGRRSRRHRARRRGRGRGVRADRLPGHRGPRRPRRAGAPGLRRVAGLLRPAAGGEARPALGRSGSPARLQRARQQEPRAHLRARHAARSARAVLHRPPRRLGRALPGASPARPRSTPRTSWPARPAEFREVFTAYYRAQERLARDLDAHLRAGARPARGLVRRHDRPPLQHRVRATSIPSPRASRCRASSARARTRTSAASPSWPSTTRPAVFRCCSRMARGTTCARLPASSSSTSAT